MGNALREELHAMVDGLSEDELESAKISLRDVSSDPFADMDPIERERLHAALAQSEREIAEGKSLSLDEIKNDPSIY